MEGVLCDGVLSEGVLSAYRPGRHPHVTRAVRIPTLMNGVAETATNKRRIKATGNLFKFLRKVSLLAYVRTNKRRTISHGKLAL